MKRWTSQHHGPPVDVHPHDDVLRAAGQRLDVGDGRTQSLLPHPALHRSLVGLAQGR